ncbi:MAG TPA: S8 family serine peptidase [Actinocrinis sp.]|uniref:S8 family peptidase n=1 Tax=Actinocrinis sp. TaxID=1920516 RepID=UPI002DDCA181|nr:S8 family serine peptidase [Actinocrinis sp.]HEV2346904.1 S8 family serine peptidase [Actinocrinis sp.]
MSVIGLVTLSAIPGHASTNPVYDQEWALSQFNVTTIRSQYQARGAGVVVAVVDTGVDSTQPDLQGSLLAGTNLMVPASPTSDTSDNSSEYHGTGVAAIIAAHAHGDPNNPQGMYGLATQAKILPVKIGDNGTSVASIDAGIRYAVDHGARVVNISAGRDGSCSSDAVDAVNYALSKNAVIVVATGNTGTTTNAVDCPAAVPGVIDVSSIDKVGHIDKYSHFGSDVTVAAPGVSIEVPARGDGYNTASGSSLAAPWVAGEAALIIGKHPDWTAGQVVRVIIDNTVQGSGQRIDDHVGYGVIDPLKALGASAPSDTSNPLGGPAVVPGASASSGVAGESGAASTPTSAASSGKSSSNIGLYAGLGVGVLALIGVIVFLITRKNNNGSGGGGGGGGGNGYYPPTPGPGGQHAQPPRSQQYPTPTSAPTQHYQSGSGYQAPQSPQPPYPSTPQQQYPGTLPPPPQAPPSGYGHGYGAAQQGQGQPPQEDTPWPQQ